MHTLQTPYTSSRRLHVLITARSTNAVEVCVRNRFATAKDNHTAKDYSCTVEGQNLAGWPVEWTLHSEEKGPAKSEPWAWGDIHPSGMADWCTVRNKQVSIKNRAASAWSVQHDFKSTCYQRVESWKEGKEEKMQEEYWSISRVIVVIMVLALAGCSTNTAKKKQSTATPLNTEKVLNAEEQSIQAMTSHNLGGMMTAAGGALTLNQLLFEMILPSR